MYNLETLTRMTGVSRRTIRYYIQREVLDPPFGGGRGAYYTAEHKERLEQIKKWSDQGVPLIHMKAMLEGKEIPVEVDRQTGVETVSWERCQIADGVELNFRKGLVGPGLLAKLVEMINTHFGGKNDE